jgi:hypothetical protein
MRQAKNVLVGPYKRDSLCHWTLLKTQGYCQCQKHYSKCLNYLTIILLIILLVIRISNICVISLPPPGLHYLLLRPQGYIHIVEHKLNFCSAVIQPSREVGRWQIRVAVTGLPPRRI